MSRHVSELRREYPQLERCLVNIKQRCYNPNAQAYHNYGGRGITVCDEWTVKGSGTDLFILWALANGWQEGLQIDRINNDGNYCPENCRWVTHKENSNNCRKTIYVEWEGSQIALGLLCDRFGVPYLLVHDRVFKLGWSLERALVEPVGECWLESCRSSARRRNNNRYVTYNGVQRLFIDVCEEYGHPTGRVADRLRLGWSLEDALQTPVGNGQRLNPKNDRGAQ